MTGAARVTFCATGKTGLGHLRRVTNIATEIRKANSDIALGLMTNSSPSGLTESEVALYDRIDQAPRETMAERLSGFAAGVVVVDTAVIPELDQIESPLCLVLRETPDDRIDRFRLQRDRPWDLVLVPNPQDDWQPPAGRIDARQVDCVGWIYRRTDRSDGADRPARSDVGQRRILVAAGGGGNVETTSYLASEIGPILTEAMSRVPSGIDACQAIGPRAPSGSRFPGVTRTFDPGPRLNDHFAAADLVISTVGYNSVLELALTDVPCLLVPVARSIDNQVARARRWGSVLGRCHLTGETAQSADWILSALEEGPRLQPIDIGPSGGRRAAERILQLA